MSDSFHLAQMQGKLEIAATNGTCFLMLGTGAVLAAWLFSG